MAKTVRERYTEWWAKVKPANPGSQQVIEMEMAFYSGYASAQFATIEIGDSELPDEEGAETLKDQYLEVEAFFDQFRPH